MFLVKLSSDVLIHTFFTLLQFILSEVAEVHLLYLLVYLQNKYQASKKIPKKVLLSGKPTTTTTAAHLEM